VEPEGVSSFDSVDELVPLWVSDRVLEGLDVEFWVGGQEDRLQVEASTENRTIEAGAASDLDLAVRVGDTLGPCGACLRVAVGRAGATRYTDAVMLDAEVIPP
jgi:hypothetical protein